MSLFGRTPQAASGQELTAASISLADPQSIRDGLTAGPWEIVGEVTEEYSAPKRGLEILAKAGHDVPSAEALRGVKCKMFVALSGKPVSDFVAQFAIARQALDPHIGQPESVETPGKGSMIFFTTEPRFTIVELFAEKSAAEDAYQEKNGS